MNLMLNQKGFSTALVIIVVVLTLSVAGFFLSRPNSKNQENVQFYTQSEPNNTERQKMDDSNEPPLKLKSIGIEFSDFKFTKEKLQFNRLFMGYGFYIPRGNDNPSKYNPQPTFIVPLGTPVRSLVDGVVAAIPTLWSGDYSIQVTTDGKMQKWIYETEHVRNPTVKVGDRVKAGQIIAEVGSFGGGDPPGFGSVEIGILRGGQNPDHVCPFAYIDDSIKDKTFIKMRDLFKSWEEYVGDKTLYDESLTIPGCLTLDSIEG